MEGVGFAISSSLDSINHKTQREEFPSYYSLSPYLLILDRLFPRMILGIFTTFGKIIFLLMGIAHDFWPLNRTVPVQKNNYENITQILSY